MTEESLLSIEFIYCYCGCGKTRSKYTIEKGRVRKDRPRLFIEGHNKRLAKRHLHHNWKNGKIKHSTGYIQRLEPNHPYCNKSGYVFEHRLVMELFLGRYLKPEEVVHHINGVKNDNRIENLELVSNQTEHARQHRPKQDFSNRSCFMCESKLTVRWYKNPGKKNTFLCNKCFLKRRRTFT